MKVAKKGCRDSTQRHLDAKSVFFAGGEGGAAAGEAAGLADAAGVVASAAGGSVAGGEVIDSTPLTSSEACSLSRLAMLRDIRAWTLSTVKGDLSL